MQESGSDIIGNTSTKSTIKQIPGWNEYCKVVYTEARDAYILWRNRGKPRFGNDFELMKRTRAYFKYVLRKCKRDKCAKNADSLANKLLMKDEKAFWKEIQAINQANIPVATTIDDVTGNDNITNMWKDHFKNLLNSSKDIRNKEYVLNNINSVGNANCDNFKRYTVDDVKESFKYIKNGKACGLDGITGEHLKYASGKLHVLLALVFNAMIIHGHVPRQMMDTFIVPLVKDKKGNLSAKDNYRPLAITCVLSKMLEILILNRYKLLFTTTDNQFGFKTKLSTEMCIYALKQITEYYTHAGSPMYICFLDASKAFDKVNHWTLFKKLIDRKLPILIVRILYVWYSKQYFYVRWNGYVSEPFNVSNGVRQGSILSPFFYNLYTDEISVNLNRLRDGCVLNDCQVNHLFYADDAVLLAPSPSAMQKLLAICDKFASEHELVYNVKKSVLMCVKPRWLKNLSIPAMYLDGKQLKIVHEQKYLGVFLTDTMKDDCDIKRQIRSIYARGNVLIKRFKFSSNEIKCKLFKAYCASFYCISQWRNFTSSVFRKIKSAYNRVFKNFLNIDRNEVRLLMSQYNVKSFNEIERQLIYGFRQLIQKSNNILIRTIVNSVFYIDCSQSNRWNRTLYNFNT